MTNVPYLNLNEVSGVIILLHSVRQVQNRQTLKFKGVASKRCRYIPKKDQTSPAQPDTGLKVGNNQFSSSQFNSILVHGMPLLPQTLI